MEEEKLCKNDLIKKIMDYKFAINDMALYLDTHTCDYKALKKHNEYIEKYKHYKEQYENMYGPLSIYEESESWNKWVYEPWPWERSIM